MTYKSTFPAQKPSFERPHLPHDLNAAWEEICKQTRLSAEAQRDLFDARVTLQDTRQERNELRDALRREVREVRALLTPARRHHRPSRYTLRRA